ncbi:MAG: anthranilate phosphoribosyltransferase, partial [Candidatus Thermochlorobacter sp.]
VVYGETKEGLALDEPSVCGATFISELKNGTISNYTVYPEDFGIKRRSLDDLRGGTVEENAQLIWQILDGVASEAKRDAAIYAGGFAIYVSGVESSLEQGILRARAELESGRAKRTLEGIIEAHRQIAPAAV